MAPAGKYNYDFRGHLVLVVEDNLISFKLIKTMLEKVNLAFIHASDGQTAVEICRDRPDIDLVLMDIQLPLMSGMDATRAILERRPGLPVIATTANAFHEDYEACMEAGCTAYITKPIAFESLFSRIQSILDAGPTDDTP